MTYRNDHDAALARVDALRHEVQRLADENVRLKDESAKLPLAATPRRSGVVVAAALVAAVGGAFAGIAATSAGSDGAEKSISVPTTDETPSGDLRSSLEHCAATIDQELSLPDARAPLDAGTLEAVGAVCREELRQAAGAGGSETLRAWANAEDQLANRVTMLTVYYSSDPAMLDNYATAPQLWRELGSSLIARNVALTSWRASGGHGAI